MGFPIHVNVLRFSEAVVELGMISLKTIVLSVKAYGVKAKTQCNKTLDTCTYLSFCGRDFVVGLCTLSVVFVHIHCLNTLENNVFQIWPEC